MKKTKTNFRGTMRKTKIQIRFLVLFALMAIQSFLPMTVSALEASSNHYRLQSATFSDGVANGSSTNYQTTSVIGGKDLLPSSSANYSLCLGFWSKTSGNCIIPNPPETPQTPSTGTPTPGGGTVILKKNEKTETPSTSPSEPKSLEPISPPSSDKEKTEAEEPLHPAVIETPKKPVKNKITRNTPQKTDSSAEITKNVTEKTPEERLADSVGIQRGHQWYRDVINTWKRSPITFMKNTGAIRTGLCSSLKEIFSFHENRYFPLYCQTFHVIKHHVMFQPIDMVFNHVFRMIVEILPKRDFRR